MPGEYKNYNNEYDCETVRTDIDTCLTKGAEISSWFAERILNPDRMCDWDKGNCASLFGAAAPPA